MLNDDTSASVTRETLMSNPKGAEGPGVGGPDPSQFLGNMGRSTGQPRLQRTCELTETRLCLWSARVKGVHYHSSASLEVSLFRFITKLTIIMTSEDDKKK